jgi:hypothetical protein
MRQIQITRVRSRRDSSHGGGDTPDMFDNERAEISAARRASERAGRISERAGQISERAERRQARNVRSEVRSEERKAK